MRTFFILMAVVVCGCSPTSIEEYRYEGEAIGRKLLQELEKIETIEDLKQASPRLKKQFTSIVDLMLSANKYAQKDIDYGEVEETSLVISDGLREQFVRIYQIEGCPQLMEEIQRESIHRLDLAIKKQRS